MKKVFDGENVFNMSIEDENKLKEISGEINQFPLFETYIKEYGFIYTTTEKFNSLLKEIRIKKDNEVIAEIKKYFDDDVTVIREPQIFRIYLPSTKLIDINKIKRIFKDIELKYNVAII